MLVELAIATRTHPDEWTDTDPRITATAIAVLKESNRKQKGR